MDYRDLAGAWFTFDPDERRDAQVVEALEWQARDSVDPAEAARLLAKADELRTKHDHPRRRHRSVAELLEELQAIARDALEVDRTDSDALSNLADRVAGVGNELEDFAMDLEEHGGSQRER